MRPVDQFLLILLKVLPKQLLSRITGFIARIPLPYPVNVLLIRFYSAIFPVDLTEVELPLSRYGTLQSFFTRKLVPSARPVDQDRQKVLSPVDGRVMVSGGIREGTLLQAKGWRYGLADLLGDRRDAARFLGGSFTTLYLSPADYHRIHMPMDGRVQSLRYIPGHLYPVNRFSLHAVENLFLLNERIVLRFATDAGDLAMVLVGATNVGKIRVVFDDGQRPLSRSQPFERDYRGEIALKRAEELGRFELGSTVILIFEKERAVLEAKAGDIVRVGRPVGFIP